MIRFCPDRDERRARLFFLFFRVSRRRRDGSARASDRLRLPFSSLEQMPSERQRRERESHVANAKREREGKTEVRPLADPPCPAAPRAAAVGFRRRGRMKETTTRDGTPPRGGAEGCFPG
jgi:hypothetical protein